MMKYEPCTKQTSSQKFSSQQPLNKYMSMEYWALDMHTCMSDYVYLPIIIAYYSVRHMSAWAIIAVG